MQLRETLDKLVELLIIEFVILRILMRVLQVLVMQIGQGILMIGRAQVDAVSTWQIIWFLGIVRNKILFLCQLLNRSI